MTINIIIIIINIYHQIGYQWGTVVIHCVLVLMLGVNVFTSITIRRRDRRQNNELKSKFC